MNNDENIIEISHLKTYLGGQWVHQDINLTVRKGEILAIVGGSGSGKTTLMREMLMLQRPYSGSIKIFNQEITTMSSDQLLELQKRWSVLFQQNALFSALNVLENVCFPLQEQTLLDQDTIERLAMLKIDMAGLPNSAAIKYPAELSGGMQKRAALARAIVVEPELIFLDEPTAGLDPASASGLDELILYLKNMLGLTVIVITHDLDSLWRITDRVAFLGEGKVLCVESMPELVKQTHPLIQEFFKGPRGRAVEQLYH